MTFLKKLLELNKRIDGREFLQQREFTIEELNNSFVLKSNKTFISLNYTMNITEPHPDKPHQGIIRINTFYPHHTERSNIDKSINRPLKNIFLKSKCIDLECLSLIFNELCIEINFEVRIIECDGNPLRFCVELLLYAIDKINFKNIKIDKNCLCGSDTENTSFSSENMCKHIKNVSLKSNEIIKESEDLLVNKDINIPEKLLINYRPRSFYIIIIDNKKLLDPVYEEDEMKMWWCLIVMDQRSVLYFEKSGDECDFEDIMQTVNICTDTSKYK